MIRELTAAQYFSADFDLQIAWYAKHAGEHVARRYSEAVVETVGKLCENPALGARCEFKDPRLSKLHFCRVMRPFQKHAVFYRFDDMNVFAERVMHGARNLPSRLLEPPGATP